MKPGTFFPQFFLLPFFMTTALFYYVTELFSDKSLLAYNFYNFSKKLFCIGISVLIVVENVLEAIWFWISYLSMDSHQWPIAGFVLSDDNFKEHFRAMMRSEAPSVNFAVCCFHFKFKVTHYDAVTAVHQHDPLSQHQILRQFTSFLFMRSRIDFPGQHNHPVMVSPGNAR